MTGSREREGAGASQGPEGCRSRGGNRAKAGGPFMTFVPDAAMAILPAGYPVGTPPSHGRTTYEAAAPLPVSGLLNIPEKSALCSRHVLTSSRRLR